MHIFLQDGFISFLSLNSINTSAIIPQIKDVKKGDVIACYEKMQMENFLSSFRPPFPLNKAVTQHPNTGIGWDVGWRLWLVEMDEVFNMFRVVEASSSGAGPGRLVRVLIAPVYDCPSKPVRPKSITPPCLSIRVNN
ncbi:hypothetical protein AVEN_169227-1 [Araneus ventricosus]|uniref:Uncharacterized protein n=1 Tax=Araneus ventricosus TaxID=182803 RepID=A0A4Y2QNW7_ARAVE|nr:hypothetical protein AVEN_169227-1 [Araneus ventricosus]